MVEVGGREFLVEPALKADVALIAARSADCAANLVYSLTARNFNPLMAMAATTVIAGANEIVPLGVPPPDAIHTPGVLVDHLVERPRPVVVAMDHTQKGAPKIVDELTLPATSHRPVTLVVTELAVIEPTRDGLALRERAPGISVEAIEAATGAALLVPAEVPEMDLSAMPAAA